MIPRLRPLLACAGLFLSSQHAFAEDPYPGDQYCEWRVNTPVGPMTHTNHLGTYYVPRDAPVGTFISPPGVKWPVTNNLLAIPQCFRDVGPHSLYISVTASVPIYPGPLPPVLGDDVTGRVLQTNIPGVGVVIKLGLPFNWPYATNTWKTVGPPIVPFEGYVDHNTVGYLLMSRLNPFITLIKTGDIPPGINELDGRELWSSTATRIGKVAGHHLYGTVIQSQCGLPPNPVSADPVELGEWDNTDFTGPGFTTPSVPFTLTLTDCEDDPEGAVATAHIRLEGAKGSTPIDAQRGIFGLTDDSTAEGVGIQMLMADGVTPVQLNEDVPLQVISPSGDTVLPFSARFYQTEASQAVKPGSAKGALNFTITYQ